MHELKLAGLAGRPRKEGGHKSKNLSLDKKSLEILEEARIKKIAHSESEFVERIIKEFAGRSSFTCVVRM